MHDAALLEEVVGTVGFGAARAARGVVALRERELVVVEGILAVVLVEPCPRLEHDARTWLEPREHLLQRVREHTGLSERPVVETAVGAVTEALGALIDHTHRDEIAAHLPAELATKLRRREPDGDASGATFLLSMITIVIGLLAWLVEWTLVAVSLSLLAKELKARKDPGPRVF